MINSQVKFYPFFKGNKLKIIMKMDIVSVVEKILQQTEFQDEIKNIEIIACVGSEAEKYIESLDAYHLMIFNSNFYSLLNQREKEKIKEKEKKEIYKERKDKEKQQEKQKVFGDGNMEKGDKIGIEMDTTNDLYKNSKKVQKFNVSLKNALETKPLDKIEKWTADDFLKYMQMKFKDTYGYDTLEFRFVAGKKYGQLATGVVWTIIKRKIIDYFIQFGLNRQSVKDYIDWAYGVKSIEIKFPVTLNLISNTAMMTEWMHDVNKTKLNTENGKKFTFTKKIHGNIKK